MNAQSAAGTFDIAHAEKVDLTVRDVFNIAIATLTGLGSLKLKTLHQIERAEPSELENQSISGTVLDPVVRALRVRGVNVDFTYGSVRRAFDLKNDHMHLVFCDCHNGEYNSCEDVAARLETLNDPELRNLIDRGLAQGLQ